MRAKHGFYVSLAFSAALHLPAPAQAESKAPALQRLEAQTALQQEPSQLRQPPGDAASRRLPEADMSDRRAAGPADASPGGGARTRVAQVSQAGEPPKQPVGQAPPEQTEEKVSRPEVQAIANVGGVLTPKGKWLLEPALQFSNSQVNRLSFQGVEILESFLIGILQAENADRDLISPSLTLRHGLTSRLEVEGKLPYIWRDDKLEATIPKTVSEDEPQTQRDLEGSAIGDAELALHYQLNAGGRGSPIFLGNVRYKSTTGDGPYDVDRDSSGNQTELPTGSGFHGIEPSITVLYPSDPAVFYANFGYLYNVPEDVDKTFGVEGGEDQTVGEVDPGNVTRVSFGMAYSINSRASFSLGYKHDFIQETDTEINNTKLSSSSLDVGSLLVGFSHQLTPKLGANLNLELGATADAPDVGVTLRLPYALN